MIALTSAFVRTGITAFVAVGIGCLVALHSDATGAATAEDGGRSTDFRPNLARKPVQSLPAAVDLQIGRQATVTMCGGTEKASFNYPAPPREGAPGYFPIAGNGQARCVVVRPAGASSRLQAMAGALQSYLNLVGPAAPEPDAAPPYPPSPVIKSIEWAPKESIIRQAKDGDNWPLTWADDDALYTTWGDGTGFVPKVEKKLSLGFARITGTPDNFTGVNVRSDAEQLGQGRAGKKGWGILCVEGVLHLWLGHADNKGATAQLAWSCDHAKTWTFADWTFAEFGLMGFVNFGRNYAGARDEFVYAYSHDRARADTPADRFILMRAPKDQMVKREAWEFFREMDGAGQPVWTRQIRERGAVFKNPDGCLRSAMTYCAPLKRYLWWQQIPQPPGHRDRGDTRFEGGFGIYDAPNPWGPWTTAFFTGNWDVGPGEHGDFPAKWMSADGRTLHLVFSGEDSFSVRQATCHLHGVDSFKKTQDAALPRAVRGHDHRRPHARGLRPRAPDDAQRQPPSPDGVAALRLRGTEPGHRQRERPRHRRAAGVFQRQPSGQQGNREGLTLVPP